MKILNLDEANRRIGELEGKLAHALEVGGARGRLLARRRTSGTCCASRREGVARSSRR